MNLDKVIDYIVWHTKKYRGATITLNGENMVGRPFYAVAARPERTVTLDGTDTLAEELGRFIVGNLVDLVRPEYAIGTWHDPATGKVHLDVVELHVLKRLALAAARAGGQRAIYDLDRDYVIYVEEVKSGS